jgi:hypothetical protein
LPQDGPFSVWEAVGEQLCGLRRPSGKALTASAARDLGAKVADRLGLIVCGIEDSKTCI